jgi:spoIIIJ-associated protein
MVSETCEKSKEFLSEIIADLRFDLNVTAQASVDGCLLNMSGNDTSLLLNEGGELLDAFETLLFQIYGREIDKTERFVCDADGFRQTRKAELHAMARFAAQNVRKSGKPFTFGKLNATERRMIHLALASESDLQTESIGEGKDRQLQVKLK